MLKIRRKTCIKSLIETLVKPNEFETYIAKTYFEMRQHC